MPAENKTSRIPRDRSHKTERTFYETAGELLSLLRSANSLAGYLRFVGSNMVGPAATEWAAIQEVVVSLPFMLSVSAHLLECNMPPSLTKVFERHQVVGMSDEQWRHLKAWLKRSRAAAQPGEHEECQEITAAFWGGAMTGM